jgi:hypothetical protein
MLSNFLKTSSFYNLDGWQSLYNANRKISVLAAILDIKYVSFDLLND